MSPAQKNPPPANPNTQRALPPITVPQGTPNIHEYVASEVMRLLGLQGETDIAAFSLFVNSPDNYLEYTINDFRARNMFAAEAAKAKGKSFTVVVYVPQKVIDDVKRYRASGGQPNTPQNPGVADQLADAGRQLYTGVRDTAAGIGKDVSAAGEDYRQGIFKTADGATRMAFSKVLSPQMGQAFDEFNEGIQQLGRGVQTFNFTGGDLTTLDAFLMLGGKIISTGHTLVGKEEVGRGLSGIERMILERIFGASVNLDEIRIKQGYAGLYSAGLDNGITLWNNNRPITHGDTIYMKNTDTLLTDGMATLVHETTHVWQHQNGGDNYMIRALHAQTFGDGYEYFDAVKSGKTWTQLNAEQQANLIGQAYQFGYFTSRQWNDPRVTPSDKSMLIQYVDNVLPQLRLGIGAR